MVHLTPTGAGGHVPCFIRLSRGRRASLARSPVCIRVIERRWASGCKLLFAKREALVAGETPPLLCESVLGTRHRHWAATPQPKKIADGGLRMERLDSCARTRRLARKVDA